MQPEAYIFGIGKSSGFKRGGLIGAFRKFAKENDFSFQEIAIRKEYLNGLSKDNVKDEQEETKIGNLLRKATGRKDIVAIRVILDLIRKLKEETASNRKVIFVVRSLKKEAEINLFKEYFGPNFYTVKASCTAKDQVNNEEQEQERIKYDLAIDGSHPDYLSGLVSFVAEKTKSGSKIDLVKIDDRLAEIEISQKQGKVEINEKLASFNNKIQGDVKSKIDQAN